MDIQNKVAVITGGASGLGRATVELFASKGASIAIFDMNADAGEAIAAELGEKVIYCNVNVVDPDSVNAALDKTVEAFGAIHICCNYAGIAIAEKTLGKSGPHNLDNYIKVVQVNQIGTFNVARLAAERMAKNTPVNADGGRGIIINTASVAAYEGQIGQVAYSATKGAIVSMTVPMARELAEFGIRVNTIVPGLIHTPLFDSLPGNVYRALEQSVVYPKRLGKPQEIAKLAAYLVDNDYMNGECVRMDGAIRMQPR